ncbi:MAG TPA: FHA domain-containing protein [Planctomycetota bacterium]|nr:FHA domain-containing protein [Planctomycetota bacterium]HPY74363.1 FHA domain-containing protein [Planctomycetota bacterium]HQA99871.1 FHA domain-containing protein [Planctomycetota bacterium]
MPYIIAGDKEYCLQKNNALFIGRACKDFDLQDELLSRTHCVIDWDSQGFFYIKDLDSHNGTFVNGEKIVQQKLQDNDKIKIGSTYLTFMTQKKHSSNPCQYQLYFPKTKQYFLLQDKTSFTIGRKKDNDLFLKSRQVSAKHAEISYKDNQWWITDLNSRNGVMLNKQKITSSPLTNNDILQIGDVFCFFQKKEQKPHTKKESILLSFAIYPLIFIILLATILLNLSLFKTDAIPEIPNNLIEDYSFESEFQWECTGNLQIATTEHSKTGKKCVQFMPISVKQKSECIYWLPLNIQATKSYRIMIWTKGTSLQGCVGVHITWFQNAKKLWDEYTPLRTELKTEWTLDVATVTPPPYATKMQISCMIHGSAHGFYLDDIQIEEIEQVQPRSSFKLNVLEIMPDIHGIFHIFYAKTYLFPIGHIQITNPDKETLEFHQTYSTFTVEKNDQQCLYKGNLHPLLSKENVQMEIQYIQQEEISILQYKLQWERTKNNHTYNMTIPNKMLDPEVENLQRQFQTFPIIWKLPSIDKRATFLVKNLKLPQQNKEKQQLQYSIPASQNRQATFEITLQIYNEQDTHRHKEQIQEAKTIQKQKQYGKAWQIYQTIIQECTIPSLVQESNIQIRQIDNQFNQDLQTLINMQETADFFQNITIYQRIATLTQQYAQQWKEYEKFSEIQKIQEKYNQEIQKIQQQNKSQYASILLKQAADMQQAQQNWLAILLYKELLLQYPEYPEKQDIETKIKMLQQTK